MANPFKEPIYITRPLLPDLSLFYRHLEEIWKSQWLSNNGDKHCKLEHELKGVLKVPYMSLFNNGTIALMVALRLLKLKGEVITTPFTFPATPHVLTWSGLKPVFCDIQSETLNIDIKKIEPLITSNTSGIFAVHVFGNPCDVFKIQELANKYSLKVIYDAAHAFQLEIEGLGIGSFGDVSMFSFHPTKLFHTAEGGALAFNNPSLKKEADLLKNFGIKNEEEVILPGINGKMNELQAAMGLSVLDMLENERQKRKALGDRYNECLTDIKGLSIVGLKQGNSKNSYQYYVIRINKRQFGKSRDEVCEELKAYNIYARKYFYPLCSNYAHYKQSSENSNLNNAVHAAEEVLALPFYGNLSLNDAEKIADIIKTMSR